MAPRMKLTLCHLYPDLMDTYGDKGNILSIIYRCQKRSIEVKVEQITVGQNLKSNVYDLFFFGGGQDKAQEIVATDLAQKAQSLKESIDKGAALLSICGGYQLLQKYFKTQEGKQIEGIGLFDAYTLGSTERMIGNLLVQINPKIQTEISTVYPNSQPQLIGFENHSGKTFLSEGTEPLGTVLAGFGNNGQDKLEGAVYKNAFGCYLHGSLLPKNPHFADYLIAKALEHKSGNVDLAPLNDDIEWQAHKTAIQRTH